MPLFAYFVVVGSVLLGLLYVAEAQLGPPAPLTISTNFHGLPAPWKAPASTPILTVRDAPAPNMAQFAFAQSEVAAERSRPGLAKADADSKANKARKPAAKTASKHNAGRNLYAQSATASRQTYGTVW